ncbi:hypothetical protein EVAR_85761_1 [Eumeta japonica]|uniref:Uncharacterized protein n=1 Tax=Eumeta variegata TaxID=151549 RepID=A0A4C1ZFR7_EUMVA|nr:hypothetical protein EVAR_85761_1 [Eumeta japonica]
MPLMPGAESFSDERTKFNSYAEKSASKLRVRGKELRGNFPYNLSTGKRHQEKHSQKPRHPSNFYLRSRLDSAHIPERTGAGLDQKVDSPVGLDYGLEQRVGTPLFRMQK